ncbi:YqgQ family protein [Desulfosporosinus sp. FKA]|uniref:YqgQ family protein n=1 Tax=Desulfosporosinus sp. FKA TaxID=1969834 RepID=UPI000B49AD3A|nr:YqgQ family protein [Desulfosporosinus sp. FKA]
MCGGGFRNIMFGYGGCGTGHYEQPYEPYPRSYAPERLSDRELIQGEIKKLYAEGTIEREQYYDALDRLNRGNFTLDDLASLRERTSEKESSTRKFQKERTPVRESSEVSKLNSKKAEIAKAKEQMSSLISELNQNSDQLKNQMALEEKLAEGTIAIDEQKAREHLLNKQDLLEQASHLETRIKELESDLKQLEGLEIKVEAKILEQEALSQREKLMNLAAELG